jgi:serine/threonine protein kinase
MPNGMFEVQAFGKYVLTDRIGAGGMAEIFRATAFGVEGFTKEICIKRILPTLTIDETFIKMFITEAKIAVNLHHANIVQVFDLGRIGEHYFIAMELVRGRDLLQIINRCRALKKRLPVPIALYLISRVCKGLEYAHRVKVEGRPAGIIHRDVSPSNILVSWEGDVKVADFGIAKASHKDEKTATGTMKGKYGYMSPEQVLGESIDQRSDIFATGILLYESLVSKRLFKGETDLETLEKVRSALVPSPPSATNKKVPVEVDQLVYKALALNRDDRFQNAGEFHDAISDRLYTSGTRMDSKILATFMQKLFAKEIEEEEKRDKERQRPDISQTDIPVYQEGPGYGTPQTPAGPPTRKDLPGGMTPLPQKKPISSFTIGLIGTSVILLVAAAIVLFYWLSNKPEVVVEPKPDAGKTVVVSPPPVRLGTLSIASQPGGAAIELNGKPTGMKTPATIEGLDREKIHALKLTLVKYKPWTKQVSFGKVEVIALEPQLIKEPKKPPPPPPKPKYGYLNINAVPVWAYVYINGKKQPRPTPIYKLKLKPGTYEIRLENPKLKLSKTKKVTIQKGKSADLVVKMK